MSVPARPRQRPRAPGAGEDSPAGGGIPAVPPGCLCGEKGMRHVENLWTVAASRFWLGRAEGAFLNGKCIFRSFSIQHLRGKGRDDSCRVAQAVELKGVYIIPTLFWCTGLPGNEKYIDTHVIRMHFRIEDQNKGAKPGVCKTRTAPSLSTDFSN